VKKESEPDCERKKHPNQKKLVQTLRLGRALAEAIASGFDVRVGTYLYYLDL
jgi:hypothetical protein